MMLKSGFDSMRRGKGIMIEMRLATRSPAGIAFAFSFLFCCASSQHVRPSQVRTRTHHRATPLSHQCNAEPFLLRLDQLAAQPSLAG